MPEISRFYGVVIRMFYSDHPPPHFHAEYGDEQAVIDLETLGVIAGRLPPRAMGLVGEWALLHADELRRCWDHARDSQPGAFGEYPRVALPDCAYGTTAVPSISTFAPSSTSPATSTRAIAG